MIISETHQFVFIHNPKCGGTSVRQALAPFDTTANMFWMFDELNGRKIDKAHMPLYLFRAKFPQYFGLMERYFVFMFVRNPYARFISAFNERHPKEYATFIEDRNDSAYRALINSYALSLRKHELKPWKPESHRFLHQADYVYLDSKRYPDLVLKLEEWENGVAKIRHFHKEVAERLARAPRRNTRPLGVSSRELLSHQAVERLASIYEADFRLFDYDARLPIEL